jgi:hypothetical protein
MTSALDGGDWSASRPGRALPPGKGPPVPIVQEAGWASEPVWTQRNRGIVLCPCRGSNPDRPVAQSVIRHNTDLATPAPDTRVYYIIIRTLSACSSRSRKEGAVLMLPQVDRALLRRHESRKRLEWRLCGSAVSNLSKTSSTGMHIKPFIDIYYIHLYFYIFWRYILFFVFNKCTGTSKFPF